MTFALNFIASSGSEVEWSRALMIAWIVIALTLSVIELFWLKGSSSPGRLAPVTKLCSRSKGGS